MDQRGVLRRYNVSNTWVAPKPGCLQGRHPIGGVKRYDNTYDSKGKGRAGSGDCVSCSWGQPIHGVTEGAIRSNAWHTNLLTPGHCVREASALPNALIHPREAGLANSRVHPKCTPQVCTVCHPPQAAFPHLHCRRHPSSTPT